MARHYSTRDFFRQMPNTLLARYFQERGLFGALDFAAMRETQPDQLFAPWLDLPDRQRNEMDAEFRDIFELSCEKGFRAIIDEAEWFGPTSVFTSSQAHTTVRILADMQTFTLEEAAAVIANQYGWHEDQQKTLLKQLLDAAKDGTLIVRHPHTDLPYRPKEHCEYYERVRVADLNRHFGEAGVPWRLDNDGETADPIFETEWWNLPQVLAWIYLGDRALVKQGALVNQGAAFDIQLMLAAADRQNACYPSFRVAQEALFEALRTGKLTAYGLRNGGLP
jgi:hypothetical protein